MIREAYLKQLSARKTSFGLTEVNFSSNIAKEHIFHSPMEVLEYLEYALSDHHALYREAPVLYANLIDKTLCSLIYEIFHLLNRQDYDTVAYIRHRVDGLIEFLSGESDGNKRINDALYVFLVRMNALANPTPDHPEEPVQFGELSLLYYNLFYTIYSILEGEQKDYFNRMRDVYLKYLQDSYPPVSRVDVK